MQRYLLFVIPPNFRICFDSFSMLIVTKFLTLKKYCKILKQFNSILITFYQFNHFKTLYIDYVKKYCINLPKFLNSVTNILRYISTNVIMKYFKSVLISVENFKVLASLNIDIILLLKLRCME